MAPSSIARTRARRTALGGTAGPVALGLLLALAAPCLAGCGDVIVETPPGTSGAAGAQAGASGAGGAAGSDAGTSGAGGDTTTITETFCSCLSDADCQPGSICDENCICMPGCSPQSPCAAPLFCCDVTCIDLQTDPNNCGACGNLCQAANANPVCTNGQCGISGCDLSGHSDCDGNPANGCETLGTCLCVPGEVETCYSGPPGTEGVGACAAGSHECIDGNTWTACLGEVLPGPEHCGGVDNDCDGLADEWDGDGDGWTSCDGDCCESAACAEHPEQINPGALEYPGDLLDNDCRVSTPDLDPYPVCSLMPDFGPLSSTKLLKAMDLCQFTWEDAPLPERTWGVISSQLTLADGSTAVPPRNEQGGVLAAYGANVAPQYGATMAALSSGTARDEDDPGFVHPQNGSSPGQQGSFDAMTHVPIPQDFIDGSGGIVPSACAPCGGMACNTAHDSIALKLRIRVPTNVGSFSFRSNFYSAEYPENICDDFNDFFVALLDSKAPGLPANKNIAFDLAGHPVSVNNAYFDVCNGCNGGTLQLIGTGMGGWNGAISEGAATGWVKNEAPVVPGEAIELRFILWDAGDSSVDSLVLLDKFRWNLLGSLDPDPHP